MSERRLPTDFQVHVPLLLAGLLLSSVVLAAQAQTQASGQAAGLSSIMHTCSANPILVSTSKKKESRKPKAALPPVPPPACLEVKGEALEVQEFLQTAARELNWRIGENRASEDSWSFVSYFYPDELEKYADTKVLTKTVKFTGGKAAVVVRTTPITDGFVRVQISANFQGEGHSTDLLAQPATAWPLNSKGILEQIILTVLQKRYKPIE